LGAIGSRRRRRLTVARPVDGATVGRALTAIGNPAGGEVLAGYRLEHLDSTHHPCLGLDLDLPYSAPGGKKSMICQAIAKLKQQVPLLDYLQALDWQVTRQLSRGRLMGLCPLHADHKPSFLVDPSKSLFYCYGCGRGGDVIRFAELYHQVKFPRALSLLHQWRGLSPLLHEAAGFYRMQLHRHSEAVAYLYQRGIRSPELIEHMQIGYAPGGGCLRGWLTQLGYPLQALQQAGLVTAVGYDAYTHRVVFPLEGNLYGRSLSASAIPHRFLPGAKGGLYAWQQARRYPAVILVEGLFDYAVLCQAGFHNVTCSLGTHLNARQFRQLCDGPRTVYLALDADPNGSGQQAAQCLSQRLRERGITACHVSLPEGHDPNSFFTAGGDARQFQALLEAAQ
ncbi:MAG: CHC2 zinc finger domain-containing protein, partial [Bradyrhizobium sp.]